MAARHARAAILVVAALLCGSASALVVYEADYILDDPMVWTPQNSPYVIEGNFFIESNGYLRITAGVEVITRPDAYINVKNILQIEGIQGLPVRFHPNTSTTTVGQWRGVIFTTGAKPYVPDTTGAARGCLLEHVTFDNPGRSATPAINVQGSAPRMLGLTVNHAQDHGVYIANSVESFDIENSTFYNNYRALDLQTSTSCRTSPCSLSGITVENDREYGMYLSGLSGSSTLTVRDSAFINTQSNLYAYTTYGSLSFINTLFDGRGVRSRGLFVYYGGVRLENCTFTGFTSWAVSQQYSTTAPFQARYNHFVDTAYGLEYTPRSGYSSQSVFSHNTFQRLTEQALSLSVCAPADDRLEIRHNMIRDSSFTAAQAISITETCSATNSSLPFENNRIVNCTIIQEVKHEQELAKIVSLCALTLPARPIRPLLLTGLSAFALTHHQLLRVQPSAATSMTLRHNSFEDITSTSSASTALAVQWAPQADDNIEITYNRFVNVSLPTYFYLFGSGVAALRTSARFQLGVNFMNNINNIDAFRSRVLDRRTDIYGAYVESFAILLADPQDCQALDTCSALPTAMDTRPFLQDNVLHGILRNDLTLSPDTTYELNEAILIQSNVTLTIPEGVRIDAGVNGMILVAGQLNIRGTATKPVVMTSSATRLAAGTFLDCVTYTAGADISQVTGTMTTSAHCTNLCRRARQAYASVQNSNRCICANVHAADQSRSDCTYRCQGDNNEFCGGYSSMRTYATGEPLAWRGIVFLSDAKSASVAHLDISYTGGTVYNLAAIRSYAATAINLTASTFHDMRGPALQLDGTVAQRNVWTNLTFSNIAHHAIHLTNQACREGCSLEHVHGNNISLALVYTSFDTSGTADSTVSMNHVTMDTVGGGRLWGFGSTSAALSITRARDFQYDNGQATRTYASAIATSYSAANITRSVFTECGKESGNFAVYLDDFSPYTQLAQVTDNVFRDNVGALFMQNLYNYYHRMLVAHNEFTANGGTYVLDLSLTGRFRNTFEHTQIEVRDNIIANNTATQSIINLACTNVYSSSVLSFAGNSIRNNTAVDAIFSLSTSSNMRPEVVANEIVENSAAVGIRLAQSGAVAGRRPQLWHNRFANLLSTGYELETSIADAQLPINASLNYWNTIQLRRVNDKVYDLLDSGNLELVSVQPFLDALGQVVVIAAEDELLQADGSLSGLLSQDWTIPANSTFVVSGMIVVQADVVLRVEEGVTMHFTEAGGLKVQGALQVLGTEANRVVFTHANVSRAAALSNALPAFQPTYIGCLPDADFDMFLPITLSRRTADACVAACYAAGFPVAGARRSSQCYCGRGWSDPTAAVSDGTCSYQCTDNSTQRCGQYYYSSVYATGLPKRWQQVDFADNAAGSFMDGNSFINGSFVNHLHVSYTGLTALAVNGAGVAMHHVDVHASAGNCVAFSGDSQGTPVDLRNLTLTRCSSYGLVMSSNALEDGGVLDGITARHVGNNGLRLRDKNSNTHRLSVRNVLVEDGASTGVYLYTIYNLEVQDIVVRRTAGHGIYGYDLGPFDLMRVHIVDAQGASNNYGVFMEDMQSASQMFSNVRVFNSQGGLYLSPRYGFSNHIVVSNLVVDNCTGDKGYYFDSTRIYGGTFRFEDSTIANSTLINALHIDIRYQNNQQHSYTRNRIEHNTLSDSVVRLEKTNYNGGIQFNLTHSVLRNNSAPYGIYLPQPTTSSGGIQRPDFFYNVFDNNVEYELYTTITDANIPVNATHNYWGTDIEYEIVVDKLHDISDDSNYERIIYFPYFVDAALDSLIDLDAQRLTIVLPDGSLGGVVTGHEILSSARATNGTFYVNSSLVVMEGAILEIEPGLRFVLRPDVAINVKGTIISHGTTSNPIEFTCDPASAFAPMQALGCTGSSSTSTYPWYRDSTSMTHESCVNFCAARGHAVAYVQRAYDCFCSNGAPADLSDSLSACTSTSYRCRGNSSQFCGAYSAGLVLGTGVCQHWGSLTFDAASQGTELHPDFSYKSGNILKHTRLSYGGNAVAPFSATVIVEGDTVLMEDVEVVYSGSHGIALQPSNAQVRPSVLNRLNMTLNQGHGLSVTARACEVACEFEDIDARLNRYNGLYIDASGFNSPISLNGANFISNGWNAIHKDVSQGNSTAAGEAGLRLNCHSSSSVPVAMARLVAQQNYGAGIYFQSCLFHLLDSDVQENGDHDNDYAIYAESPAPGTIISRNNVSHSNGGIYITNARELTVADNELMQLQGTHALYLSVHYNFYSATIRITGNTLQNNDVSHVAYISGSWRTSYAATLEISNNDILDNIASDSIVYLSGYGGWPVISTHQYAFTGNRVLGNRIDDIRKGALQIDGYTPKVDYNFLVNPDLLTEIISAVRCTSGCSSNCPSQCAGNLTATDNWWGSADPAFVSTRVVDARDDTQFPFIITTPHLTSASFDCSAVNNCSGHGTCSRPQMCTCDSGYTGTDCSNFTCTDVFGCNANNAGGVCIGPNTCNCTESWESAYCTTPICRQSCEQGICVRPDQCQCIQGWAGNRCDECAPDYAGNRCNIRCPACANGGHCLDGRNGTGQCVCPAPFTGLSCTNCLEGFFGTSCGALPATRAVVPAFGLDVGGYTVAVRGYNLSPFDNHMVRWGPGTSRDRACTFEATDRLLCEVAPSPSGATDLTSVTVTLYINGSLVQYGNSLTFQYQAVCPDDACVHGTCFQRQCACLLGWSGANCSIPVLAPVLVPVTRVTLREGEVVYETPFSVSTGTSPLFWRMTGAPSGLTLGSSSAALSWNKAVARADPYGVRVYVRNSIAEVFMDVLIDVPLQYAASGDVVDVGGQVVSGGPQQLEVKPGSYVQVRGSLTPTFNDSAVGGQAVSIWLLRQGFTPQEVVVNSIFNGVFSYYWTFSQNQAGRFFLGTTHPANRLRSEMQSTGYSLVFHNLRITSGISISGYPGLKMGRGRIENLGDLPLTNLTYRLPEGLPAVLANMTVTFESAQLAARSSMNVDISCHAPGPFFSASFYIVIQTQETGSREFGLYTTITVRDPEPRLELSPSRLAVDMTRGEQQTFAITVSNTGGAATGPLSVRLAQNAVVSLGSPPAISNIAPGNSTSFNVVVYPSLYQPIGRIGGTLVVSNSLVSKTLSYDVNIISSSVGNLTIVCEDEFTFFDPAEPRLEGAYVRITSTDGRINTYGYTDGNGTIVFPDIPEAYYNIRVTASGHAPHAETVRLVPAGRTVRAFLARQAVSYTWSVTPVTITESYKFTVEATFVTRVPMPVVTVEPIVVDLTALELEATELGVTYYNYVVTNHGLIRANDFNLVLPAGHPYLEFSYPTPIGGIEANTSVVVPVTVTYVGDAHTFIGLTFSGGAPCFSSGDGRGYGHLWLGGNGGGSSSSRRTGEPNPGSYAVVPSNTKTLSFCDPCVKSLLECLIGFVPGAGCAYACGEGASAAPGRSRWGNLYGVSNCVLACLGGPVASAAMCLWTVGRDCLGLPLPATPSRRRRATSPLVQARMEQTVALSEAYRNQLSIFALIYSGPLYFTTADGLTLNEDANKWLSLNDKEWQTRVGAFWADTSDGGIMLTPAECRNLTDAPPATFSVEGVLSAEAVAHFCARWNNTQVYFDQGITSMADVPEGWDTNFIPHDEYYARWQQLQADYSKLPHNPDGTASFDDQMYRSYIATEDAALEDEVGKCVEVRVRIEQEMTLTRTAFEGSLELTNDAEDPLENIRVVLYMLPHEERNVSRNVTHLFVIGQPSPVFAGGVNGNGTVPGASSGKATWLFMALRDAAPTEAVLYDVGGEITYTVRGTEFRITMYPDTITVYPDPRLQIKYFWDSIVYSDDPFTEEVEPAIPFSLAVMIHNDGAGTARDMQIVSGQPEIIENKDGLLVSFTIVRSRLNYEEISTSLSVTVGEVAPYSSSVVRWDMVCPLQGQFKDFNATMEYESPLGDQRLSIVDNVTIYPLVRIVRFEAENDDVPDFLTDDFLGDAIPDTLHSSYDNNEYPLWTFVDHSAVNVSGRVANPQGGFSITVMVPITNAPTYVRIDDPVEDTVRLSSVQRLADGSGGTLPGENVWRTYRVKRSASKVTPLDYLHLFDHASAGVYVLNFDDLAPVSQLTVIDVSESDATILWLPSIGANTYRITARQAGAGQAFAPTSNNSVTTAESFTVEALQPATTYEVRVQAGVDGQFEAAGQTVQLLTPGTRPSTTPEATATPTPTVTSTQTARSTSTDGPGSTGGHISSTTSHTNAVGSTTSVVGGSTPHGASTSTPVPASTTVATSTTMAWASITLDYDIAATANRSLLNDTAAMRSLIAEHLAKLDGWSTLDAYEIVVSPLGGGVSFYRIQVRFRGAGAATLESELEEEGLELSELGLASTGHTPSTTQAANEASSDDSNTGIVVGVVVAIVVVLIAVIAFFVHRARSGPHKSATKLGDSNTNEYANPVYASNMQLENMSEPPLTRTPSVVLRGYDGPLMYSCLIKTEQSSGNARDGSGQKLHRPVTLAVVIPTMSCAF
ncbi:uncharacterized protein MONBRDRAFT_24936 [Monosiga brevicollis MX1]|uniref:Uncharacterized protein n=1 Tax=Monosiga brevicollis TaxID=81824 RepID=A9UY67_MONBE|nr:uncharacterized protein MONBRDRAFT_24936 [Monosiga brevicollis MX1]EDQ89805.1 predicted protein [Monosiga brevicollis MX1]|eukprot:XP_001745227.1 hypothetical protein [Monosiga brevicollis MX1]